MTNIVCIRPIERRDYAGWRPLWDGYNHYYGRHGAGRALYDKLAEHNDFIVYTHEI